MKTALTLLAWIVRVIGWIVTATLCAFGAAVAFLLLYVIYTEVNTSGLWHVTKGILCIFGVVVGGVALLIGGLSVHIWAVEHLKGHREEQP